MSLVIWPAQPAAWVAAIREAAGGVPVLTPADEAAALAAAPDAEGWIGRLTPALLERAPRLRWLQAPSISLEHTVFPDLVAHVGGGEAHPHHAGHGTVGGNRDCGVSQLFPEGRRRADARRL